MKSGARRQDLHVAPSGDLAQVHTLFVAVSQRINNIASIGRDRDVLSSATISQFRYLYPSQTWVPRTQWPMEDQVDNNHNPKNCDCRCYVQQTVAAGSRTLCLIGRGFLK